ncbi:hypothetical protein P3T76_000819 [Phytophthora citrophthora]|uniref:RXLR phytopathogen effector protein WY-domain domain-containing protein n=1 Tax=Phytophthora citrophthora TaxID=4793 RepID=A0AAD9LSP7_9STRA|nr:hypothetical protein P3T76_000819 [Phytophthora citrophthora]
MKFSSCTTLKTLNFLSEPRFAVWAKYVDDLNANKEEAAAAVSIIPTLRKHYGDEDLFKIVQTAKWLDKMETMGTKLEDAFVQFWIQGKETPENVLVKLGLGKRTKTLLENPLLNILTKSTEVYSIQYKKRRQ